SGPDADKPGFDVASFWSRAGVAALTIPKGQEPFALRTAFGDHTTSMAAAAGICAALVEAGRTGRGRLVEASLLRTALYAMGSDFAIQLFFGRVGSTKARREAIQPLMNFFQTKDKSWVCIVARQGGVDWQPLCRALELDSYIEDPRFDGAKGRRKHAGELVDLLDEAFARFTKADIAKQLDAEQIAWAPVQTLAEVAADPQVMASGAITKTPSSDGANSYASPASPVRFPGADDGPKGPSPQPGQHTSEVLEGLGYSSADIDELITSGAVQ
ncbi:MAG: CaiB/BaiF CoA-transferase family protein, partial [Pseudomonadota bacterium]